MTLPAATTTPANWTPRATARGAAPRQGKERPAGSAIFDRRGVVFACFLAAMFWALAATLGGARAIEAVTVTAGLTLLCYRPRLLPVAAFGVLPVYTSAFNQLGVNISASDWLVVLSTPLLLASVARGRLRGGAVGAWLVVFLLACTFSGVLHWEGRATVVSLARNYTVSILPLLLFANVADRPNFAPRCFAAYCVGATVLGVSVLATFATGGIEAAMYTVGMHKNALGPSLGLGIAVAFGWLLAERPTGRRRTLLLGVLGVCGPALVLSLSRGGWLATGATCCLLLLLNRRVRVALYAGAFLVVVAAAGWSLLPEDKVEYASDFSTEAGTIASRIVEIERTMDIFYDNPVFGAGLGLRKFVAPHNMAVEMLGEIGLVGTTLFAAAVLAAYAAIRASWRSLRKSERQLVAAGHNPAGRAWLVVSVSTAVLTLTLLNGMFDAYWRRGVGSGGWMAVGLCLAAADAARRRARRVQAEASRAGPP